MKGFYRRPFRVGETTLPDGGGRVTELTARPLLNLFYPDLAAVAQPLAGEIAARREVFESLPFVTGYGVDIGAADRRVRAGSGSTGSPRSTSTCARTPTSPCATSGRWRSRCSRRWPSRLEREGRLRGPLAGTFTAPGDGGPLRSPGEPVERPPLQSLRAAA